MVLILYDFLLFVVIWLLASILLHYVTFTKTSLFEVVSSQLLTPSMTNTTLPPGCTYIRGFNQKNSRDYANGEAIEIELNFNIFYSGNCNLKDFYGSKSEKNVDPSSSLTTFS